MLFTLHIIPAPVRKQVCNFSINHVLRNINNAREARFMNKLMGRNKTKTKFYNLHGFDNKPTPGGKAVIRPINQRRMSVLNKLFMKNITEVLATGSTSHSIEGLGIEISKVAITSDFQNLNVLYVCKTKPRPPDLDQILVDAGFSLRHELSQLKLMGEVPLIHFLEDKTLKRLAEVEELLAEADKGPEDVIDESTLDSDKFQEEALDNFNLSQQVYGLYHTKIFDKIVAGKRASSVHKPKTDVTNGQEGMQYVPSKNGPSLQNENPKHIVSKYLKESKAEYKH